MSSMNMMTSKKRIKKSKKSKEFELRGRPSKKSSQNSEKICLSYSEIISKPKKIMCFKEYHLFFKLCLEYKYNEKQIHQNEHPEVPRQELTTDISPLNEDKFRFYKLLRTIIRKTESTVPCVPQFFDLVEWVAFNFVLDKETVEEKVNSDEKIKGIVQNFSGGSGDIVGDIKKICQTWQELYANHEVIKQE